MKQAHTLQLFLDFFISATTLHDRGSFHKQKKANFLLVARAPQNPTAVPAPKSISSAVGVAWPVIWTTEPPSAPYKFALVLNRQVVKVGG